MGPYFSDLMHHLVSPQARKKLVGYPLHFSSMGTIANISIEKTRVSLSMEVKSPVENGDYVSHYSTHLF